MASNMPLVSVLAIFGPTGVGKTAVAVALAERLRERGERPVAVSADALQVYRGLEVLTGVASASEQARLEHRLVSFLAVDQPFSAGEYARLAHKEIDELLAEGATPIVVGGTGLYLRAALSQLDLRPPVDPAVRARFDERSPAELHAELCDRAPQLAERVRPSDRQRLVRSLALLEQGDRVPAAAGAGSERSVDGRDAPADAVDRPDDGARGALRSDRRPRRRHGGRGRRSTRCVARTRPARRSTARKALGFDELLAGDVEAMQPPHAQLRQAPADVAAQAARRRARRRHRPLSGRTWRPP